jgi:hypothetical protein
VESQQVIPSELEPADGWVPAQSSVRAMPIVAMQPFREVRVPFTRMAIDATVEALAHRCLNEAFGLAIGPRRVRLGEQVAQLGACAGGREELVAELRRPSGRRSSSVERTLIKGQSARSCPLSGSAHGRL